MSPFPPGLDPWAELLRLEPGAHELCAGILLRATGRPTELR